MALKLRATRPPRARSLNDSLCAPAHNTPLPLERSPPASFKRLLDSALVAAESDSRDTNRQTNHTRPESEESKEAWTDGIRIGIGHSPIAAATMMRISGPQPRMKRPRPTRTQRDCRYSRM